MKIISWNVNGIRAIAKKNFFEELNNLDADILCIQETKAQDNQVNETLQNIDNYHIFSNSAERKGYSGTAILSKTKPLSVTKDINIDQHDKEGRVICLEYKDFFVINVYVPNSGSKLLRLAYREVWDKDFFEYLRKLNEKKPVIVCGDFNVAHKEIDLARPKANYDKSAGFTQREINGMDRYTNEVFADSFRHLNPNTKDAYSWWSYRGGARDRNVGWRIDYVLVSSAIINNVSDAFILSNIKGSDHCPVGIEIN